MRDTTINLLRDHFIPHEGNDHHPLVLRHRALFGYSVLLVLLKVLVFVVAVSFPSALVFSKAITSGNVISLTNETRSSLNLVELRENSLLAAAAQAKADDIMLNQYFAHTSPAGKTPWDWIRSAGYAYTFAGENLAVYYTTAEDVTAGWLASPTHRANIVNERFSEIGVGVARGMFEGFDTFVVVQMFGEPVAGKEIAVEPVEAPEAPVVVTPAPEQPIVVAENPPTEERILGEVTEVPVIEQASLSLVPAETGYKVTLDVAHAETVEARVGTSTVVLAPVEEVVVPEEVEEVVEPEETEGEVPVTWTGTIPVDTTAIQQGGEPLYVQAAGSDGSRATQAVAWVAPEGETPDLYAFSTTPRPQVKLFGFIEVGNLQDIVGRIYFLTIVGLGAALLVSLIAKFEHQRHSMTAHAMLVILLAMTLAVL